MSIFKRVLFAMISARTLHIGNVKDLPPKRGVVRPPDPHCLYLHKAGFLPIATIEKIHLTLLLLKRYPC